ncbi:MAG: chromate transporter [Ruminococcaceae bacterium]|nr:chromate transporter [Oscillospiraceae bacterium]
MTYVILFLEFLKIGAFTFGGGYAMIPFIQETVIRHEWLTTQELVDFIAVSESTPGAFAVNISTYVGSQVGGFFGAVCATLGVVLPAFVIILILAKIYDKFKNSKKVQGAMFGLKSTVVGLIGATVISIAIEVFFADGFSSSVMLTSTFWFSVVIFAVMLFLLLYKKFSPILIVVLSATLGIIAGYTGII